MEGKGLKSVIMCVLILGLVVEQIQAQGSIYICCRIISERLCYNNCRQQGISELICASECGCEISPVVIPCFRFNLSPNSEEAKFIDYCKLGCTSSVCDTMSTHAGSEEVNDAVKHCNNACSRFCTKDVENAMITA